MIGRFLDKKHHPTAGKAAALVGRTPSTVPAVEIGIAHALWNLVAKIIRKVPAKRRKRAAFEGN